MGHVVAVVGATGAVGREMLRTLERREFPCDELRCLASARSSGKELPFRGKTIVVEELTEDSFDGVDIALFSAGGSTSRKFAPAAAAAGAVVIDNSSDWRMDPDCPLVVPEVTAEAARRRPKGIIANPNCSTIQMMVALKPLHDEAGIRHIIVSTYQAASGKGKAAVDELHEQRASLAAGEGGYSEEELKLVNETRKILEDPEIGVTPTCVRVPVATGHAESIHVQFHKPLSAARARELLAVAEGVVLGPEGYEPGAEPQPRSAAGTDPVYVGRVRDDLAVEGAINLWVVADNLLKGAALNAVQIAELVGAEK